MLAKARSPAYRVLPGDLLRLVVPGQRLAHDAQLVFLGRPDPGRHRPASSWASSIASTIGPYPVHRHRLPCSSWRISARREPPAAGQRGRRRHQHARGAEAALRGVLLVEGALQWTQRPVGLEQPGRGGDRRAVHLRREHEAAAEVGSPSTRTVQAPQIPSPQPYFGSVTPPPRAASAAGSGAAPAVLATLTPVDGQDQRTRRSRRLLGPSSGLGQRPHHQDPAQARPVSRAGPGVAGRPDPLDRPDPVADLVTRERRSARSPRPPAAPAGRYPADRHPALHDHAARASGPAPPRPRSRSRRRRRDTSWKLHPQPGPSTGTRAETTSSSSASCGGQEAEVELLGPSPPVRPCPSVISYTAAQRHHDQRQLGRRVAVRQGPAERAAVPHPGVPDLPSGRAEQRLPPRGHRIGQPAGRASPARRPSRSRPLTLTSRAPSAPARCR